MRNQLLGGRYRILERIGEGGMAYVYVALDEKLGRRVAIKVLHEHMERNEDIRKRFQLEAQAVSGLDHPNIVKIYDFSGASTERLWIVTEIIDGKNLAQFVEKFRGHELHPVLAACIVREIAKAMQKAHSQGIVHRDIKPENIMITGLGLVKLMDFGIAKDLGKSSMTLTGTFMGSPSYMSPEQVRGRDVDHRSDLYSLAVLFYEIVTGRLPFTGQSTHDVVLKIMDGKYTYPRFIIPSIPEPLDKAIVKGMSMDPNRRFQSAAECGQVVDRFLEASGFDESHVELERYFRNPRAYQKRLAASPLGRGSEPTIQGHVPRPPIVTTQDRKTAAPSHHVPPRPKQKTTPPRANDTWQQHLPPSANKTTAESSQRTARLTHYDAKTVALKNQQRPQTQYKGNGRPNARPPRETIIGTTGRRGHAEAQVAVPRPPPRVKRVSNGRAAKYKTAYPESSNALSVFFGVLLVSVIAAIAIWGFWELSDRLTPVTQQITTDAEPLVKLPAVPDRPQPTRVPHLTIERPKQPATSVKSTKRPPYHSTRKPKSSARIVRRVIRSSKTQPSLVVEQADIEQPRIKPRAPATRPVVTAKPLPTVAVAVTPETTPVAKGPAKISISSQPAAEIFIDGRRMGTTVDHTTGSGWLSLSSGRHVLELRRRGYETYKSRFTVSPQEQRAFPMVNLTQESENSAPEYTLTLRVSPLPSAVTIRDMDRNQTQAFALKTEVKSVQLPAGRYQVKVTHGEESKERHVVLSGHQRNLTFAVDFKPGD